MKCWNFFRRIIFLSKLIHIVLTFSKDSYLGSFNSKNINVYLLYLDLALINEIKTLFSSNATFIHFISFLKSANLNGRGETSNFYSNNNLQDELACQFTAVQCSENLFLWGDERASDVDWSLNEDYEECPRYSYHNVRWQTEVSPPF